MIQVLGIDAAFANMGFVRAGVSLELFVQPYEFFLCETTRQDKKVVRKSSDDLRRAIELREALHHAAQGCTIAFVEVPTGSLSASAARSLGIAVGVLASCPIPVVEVSPMEVKRVVVPSLKGNAKGADKKGMIEWAVERWPNAPWFRDGKGKILNKNEHLADAMATVCAGLKTPAFQQLMALQHATSSPPHVGPSSDRPSRPRLPLADFPVARKRVRG